MNPKGLCCGVRSGREVRERMAGPHLRGSHPGKDFIPETARGYDFCPMGYSNYPIQMGLFFFFFFL